MQEPVTHSSTFRLAGALTFLGLNQQGQRQISMECPLSWIMSGPYWDHVWSSFTYRQTRALKFSRLSLHALWPKSMESLFLGTMSGPGLDHVWPNFTSRPARPRAKTELTSTKAYAYGLPNLGDHVRALFGA